MKFSLNAIGLVSITAALAACGGGTEIPAYNGNTYVPTNGATPLVTSVPTPSYAANSEELAAFNLLNAERQRCGFGLLAQNTHLDQASQAHADWILINGVASHTETQGTPGYTGNASEDRIAATGYAQIGQFDSQDDFGAKSGSANKTGFGAITVRDLLNAPYHAASVLDGFKELGISVRSSAEISVPYTSAIIAQFNPAYKYVDGRQQPAAGTLRTYPCAGATGVARQLTNEMPNPVPGRDLMTTPLGSTISLQANEGEILDITSASMIEVGSGHPVTLRTPVTAANDPNGRLTSNKGYVSADATMNPNTTYQITINGAVNGAPFSRTFSFVTGS